MAAPTISLSLQNLRKRMARKIDDSYSGTASGGSTTTLTIAGGDLIRYPTDYLKDSEISSIAGTGSGQSRHATASSVSGTTLTVTVPSGSAVDSTTTYEIHQLRGLGFSKSQYDDAINVAIDSLADHYWTDTDTVHFGFESSGPVGVSSQGLPRHEYPIPPSLNYMFEVHRLNASPATQNALGTFNTYRSFGKTTGPTRLAQGFKIQLSGFYEWFMVGMRTVGTPVDNLVLTVMTDSAGLASGTAVTDGTSDNFTGSSADNRLRYIPFRVDPPVFLSSGTQYHWSVTRDGATSDTNYYQLAEDTDNTYSYGSAQTYSGSYSAVSGSDYCFVIYPSSTSWMKIPRPQYDYRRVGTDQLYLPETYLEGMPFRIVGAAAIAEVSVETSTVPIRPDYAEAFGLRHLMASRSGLLYPSDYRTALQAWSSEVLAKGHPARALPANAIQVFA